MTPQSSAHIISEADVRHDIDVMIWSMKLYTQVRYFHQRYWETESVEAEHAMRIEGSVRLENVAEHSWHVADSVLLLADHFPNLSLDSCLRMALLHDKMEIITGDGNPVGRDGTGQRTYAFDPNKQISRNQAERSAIASYAAKLRPSAAAVQVTALNEILEGQTENARFVKAVDKLQALAYIFLKKQGNLPDSHLLFTLRYGAKAIGLFPDLKIHYGELKQRLMAQVAQRRSCSIRSLEQLCCDTQLTLNLDTPL